jgi:flagellar basal body L-ring protein FlgH
VWSNISASGSADSALDKEQRFGLRDQSVRRENKFPGWLDATSSAAIGANTGFNRSSSTARNGSLSAVITARREVLPNGDLVLEGIAKWTSAATSSSSC